MNARLFRYASVGAMLALSLGSALPTQAAPPKPNETTRAPSQTASPAAPMVGSEVIYDSLIYPQPPNVPSQPFQAQQVFEFGDHIAFGNTARIATKVTVLMSAFAVRSAYPSVGDVTGWTHPITLKLYNVNAGPVPGAVIAAVTQSFRIPWRPAGDPTCPNVYGQFGWRAGDNSCNNGLAFPIVFDLTGMNVTLPNAIIYGISYNTQSYGVAPLGVDGPYNGLNAGAEGVVPSVGTDVNPSGVFLHSITPGVYCDGGSGGAGTFREDSSCWVGYVPNVRFEATTNSTIVVRPGAMHNWTFYNDTTDTPNDALGTFVTGPGTPITGKGSAQITIGPNDPPQRTNLATYQFAGTKLSDITEMKFEIYNPSGKDVTTGFLNFNVDFEGTDAWQHRLVFSSFPVAQNTWRNVNALGSSLWHLSQPENWPAGLGGGDGSIDKTWDTIVAYNPGVARIRLNDGHLGLRVGSGNITDNYTENFSSFTFGTAAGTTIFDFEPAGLTINPPTKLVGVGETFSLDLVANGVTDLFGYSFDVVFDQTKLSATGSFENSFFDTTGGVPLPAYNANCTTVPGTCKFAATKLSGAGSNGTGTLGRITFTALQAGVWNVNYGPALLSDHNGLPIASGTQNAVVTVYGTSTFNGVVKLQGRATPVSAGTVTAVDPSGTFLPAFVAFNAVSGAYSLVVPALMGGTNWQITADHSVYLYNRTTVAGVTPGATTVLATQTLWGGDANNDETVTVADLSCVGGAFNASPVVCGVTGSSDLNEDGMTNIFDLVLVGSNYNKVSPQPWQ